jgi:hypothetical protein
MSLGNFLSAYVIDLFLNFISYILIALKNLFYLFLMLMRNTQGLPEVQKRGAASAYVHLHRHPHHLEM